MFVFFSVQSIYGQLTGSQATNYYTICMGETMGIQFQGSGGTPPYVFHYSFNGGTIETVSSGTSNTATVMYTASQTGDFTCTLHQIDDAFTSTQLNSTAQLQVVPLPNVSAGPDVTICQGQSFTPIAMGAMVYSWNNGVTNYFPFQPSATATYTVVGTDIYGCSNTDDLLVTVLPYELATATATIDSSSCNDGSIYLSIAGDNPPFTAVWQNVPTQTVVGNLAPGNYTVLINDAVGCQFSASYQVPQSSQPLNCGTVKGKVIFDRNANCVEDAGDHIFQNHLLRAMPGDFYFTTDLNGNFSKSLPPGDYTIEKLQNNSGIQNVCNPSYDVNLAANQIIQNLNIYDSISGEFDYEALIYHLPVTCVWLFTHKIKVKEIGGNFGIHPMNAWLSLPPSVSLHSWSHPHTVSNDTIYFQIDQANNSADDAFISTMTLDPGISSLGAILDFCFGISTDLPESNLSNNIYCGSEPVIGPYDPNDITLYKSGRHSDSTLLLTDVDLTYRIRFQNTGTAEAINVFVLDTISDKLDMSTLQLVETSHLCNLSILNNNVLRFDFPNIHLIDSTTNEPESHGYIFYKIKPKSSNQVGDVIKNTAHIYFDFNEAVVTNTAYDSIIEPSVNSIASIQSIEQLVIYPNPTTGKFQLNIPTLNGRHTLEVIDLQGKLLVKEPLYFKNGLASYQLNLDPGMYCVRIINSSTHNSSIARLKID